MDACHSKLPKTELTSISYLFTSTRLGKKLQEWIFVQPMAIKIKCNTNSRKHQWQILQLKHSECAWKLGFCHVRRHRIVRCTLWSTHGWWNKSIIWISFFVEFVVRGTHLKQMLWKCIYFTNTELSSVVAIVYEFIVSPSTNRHRMQTVRCPRQGFVIDLLCAFYSFISLHGPNSRVSNKLYFIFFLCQCRWRALDKRRG